MLTPSDPPLRRQIDIESLISQFYSDSDTLATFEEVAMCPPPFDQLLDHNSHMTVTVEAFHGEKVDVVVHRSCNHLRDGRTIWQDDPALQGEGRRLIAEQTASYSREITLVTHAARKIVQYGLVRLDPSTIGQEVWMEIAGEGIPLGRALINHNVLRSVELDRLWRITPNQTLASFLGTAPNEVIYGRTALIRCNDQPAIELVEIVRE
ncbi:hypothetical protein [Allorhodopirellula solitaria]|uniref:Uncharacterized protein n=1 Tax=Allorhodopirellula solitaria TaxID=2527987 RepID=A0A5C5XZ78_9BACT|nr:hypothetical protein [Allorhodopirellula solitaria]TWT67245.1 hypothetical protein CA85_20950 [Allorhodopirellula solitaria]